ncbi:hypothetical protein JTB14_030538 [Gonioctena quinquepunctata]|nr:hypothetical protein JTB14_030538 [Gonioctena quinquepunctata]
MNRRHLNGAELGRFAARFGGCDSEDDVPNNLREEDRDFIDAPSEHSDHESESEMELCSDAEMEQDPDDAEMEQESVMQKWNDSQMKQK